MNKMIVTVFQKEGQAYEGLSALKNLHLDGDITLYASAVIAKDDEGKIHIIQTADDGPVGTALGMFTGALIGLLAGPAGVSAGAFAGASMAGAAVTGSAIGIGVGGITGSFFDLSKSEVDYQFVEEVSQALEPNMVALIADVDETWITPMNKKMQEIGGMVFRRLRYEVVEDQFLREIDAYRDEMKSLKSEWKTARGDAKIYVEEQINLLEKKIETLKKRTEDKLHDAEDEMNSKLERLNEQVQDSVGRKKERLVQNVHKLKADFAERKSKMDIAIDHAKQALSPNLNY